MNGILGEKDVSFPCSSCDLELLEVRVITKL